ncbi:uncharacterized protein M421DRAFT_424318 [Didymella exigua CBS 183.55]|uniref:Uncharacterized protein n=1 Tax=Didymella exigua CBS 183.55 TaxID=1150837 RepID=A0A6A5RBZ9_9PLEO|nr:uncharacterized protein M421DRAFT_424318 [Didymella exigua CBS 183.55]KAF1924899.1 hypothetical protein M421DRAFT_424318 [Didymella exigua CBS 183.55]
MLQLWDLRWEYVDKNQLWSFELHEELAVAATPLGVSVVLFVDSTMCLAISAHACQNVGPLTATSLCFGPLREWLGTRDHKGTLFFRMLPRRLRQPVKNLVTMFLFFPRITSSAASSLAAAPREFPASRQNSAF